jgi:hypothetical protein
MPERSEKFRITVSFDHVIDFKKQNIKYNQKSKKLFNFLNNLQPF